MRGCMVTVAGYTLEYIGAMDFWRASELMKYWAKFPPVHLQLRALIGGSGSSSGPSPTEIESAVQDGAYVPGRGQDGAIPPSDLPDYVRDWLVSLKGKAPAHGSR